MPLQVPPPAMQMVIVNIEEIEDLPPGTYAAKIEKVNMDELKIYIRVMKDGDPGTGLVEVTKS